MKNLIVEMQSFKAKNEQLKKAQEKQQEINKMLLQILHERNNGKEQRTETRKNQENLIEWYPRVGKSGQTYR